MDVCAYHPYKLSNSYIFYKEGWRGINIEPNPRGFNLLCKYRYQDTNLNLAISKKEDKNVEFICNDVFSRISDVGYKRKSYKQIHRQAVSTRVKTLPLSQVLERHVPNGVKIDFFSVDCEGHDELVLRSNDWNQFRPILVLVEDNPALNRGCPKNLNFEK